MSGFQKVGEYEIVEGEIQNSEAQKPADNEEIRD